jgi:inner membrane protein
MASLGHIAVGMAAARLSNDGERPSWQSMAAWSALSMLPDADVLGMALGVPYEHSWGHRGATHSLLFAVAVGGVVGWLAPRFGGPRGRTWLIATVVAASHSLLDTLTDGGLGCALLWPFDLTRYFAPWQPIPVSPIGLAFLSPQGAFVAAIELMLFAPLFWFAWRARATRTTRSTPVRRTLLVLVWLSFVWLVGSTDPLRQQLISSVVREQTMYASRFSEEAFHRVVDGMTEADVRQLLGAPLEQSWFYAGSETDCRVVHFVDDAVARWRNFDGCTPPGVTVGMSTSTVRDLAGPTGDACWSYTRSGGGRAYRGRAICFERGKVIEIMSRWLSADREER